jgi:hypothetical protein
MTTLHNLLEATSYRLLRVIARQRGVAVPHNCPRNELVALAERALSDPERLQAALDRLSPAERAVLKDLRLAGGRLPRYHVTRRHGDLRRYRPWRGDAPSRPWEEPRSPTERVYFLGLVFWDDDTRDLVIPEDLLALYPAPQRLTTVEGLEPKRFPTAMLAHHDLAQLLASTPTRLLRGRWLSPRFLREWGERCRVAPLNADARSELQTERRRFLHYLAGEAGLAALAGSLFEPTPTGWAWLGANPLARFGMLWEALSGSSDETWRAYRLPGHALLHHPPLLIEAILRALRRDVAGALDGAFAERSLGTPESFAGRLLARDPRPRNDLRRKMAAPDEALAKAIVAWIEGPLRWLGAVDSGPEGDLHVTAWGAHWLHPRAPAPEIEPSAPFTLEPELVFAPPEKLPDLLALATLSACAERLEERRFQVTRASLVGALHRGHALPLLLARLNEIAQRPLSGEERRRLTEWAADADRMAIRRLTVLEVDDPAILARLSDARRGRCHVVRTLGRRAVAVDEGRLSALVRRLTKQEGAPPRVEVESPADPARSTPPEAGLGRGGAAHLWLAAKVYRALGQFIELPTRLPHDLVRRLATLAEPGPLSAAEVAFERTVEALQDAIQGRAAFPVWTETVLPVEESAARIEAALAEGLALEMDYYTAGRDALTHRVVEPHRLEYRGAVAYLVGFCRRAQAERVFRVDRIRALELVSLLEESDGMGV